MKPLGFLATILDVLRKFTARMGFKEKKGIKMKENEAEAVKKLQFFMKLKNPQHLSEIDVSDLIEYCIGLDYEGMMNFMEKTKTANPIILSKVFADPNVTKKVVALVEEETQKKQALQMWGKRKSGIN